MRSFRGMQTRWRWLSQTSIWMATSTCSLVSSRGLLTTGYYLPLTSYYSLLTIYYLLLTTGEDESNPNKLLVFTHCPLSSGAYGRTSLEGSGCVTCAGKEIRHLPRATCYLPPATCYLPPATYHLLPTTCYLLRMSTFAHASDYPTTIQSTFCALPPTSSFSLRAHATTHETGWCGKGWSVLYYVHGTMHVLLSR